MPRTKHRLVAALPVLAASLAHAEDLLVPDDFPTIQDAIFAASDGDSVIIAPGIYNEAIDLMGKLITVRSTDPTNPTVVDATIIDASGLNTSVILCVNEESSQTTIAGLSITGGTGSLDKDGEITGGGIRIFQAGPTISQCQFFGNSSPEDGGAIYIDDGSPFIERCTFNNNVAGDDAGAIAVRGLGGMTLTECTFFNNAAGDDGGAIRIRDGGAEIDACLFQKNAADGDGGAVNAHPDASVTITDSTFCGNSPDDIFGEVEGGGNDILGGCDSDTDGDGLLDLWETLGIPYISVDGSIDFYVLPEADKDHKNLYVELDHMATLSFSQDIVDKIELAFLLAPVPNPDGFNGIDLFIDVDDGDIPFQNVTQTPGNNFPADAGLIRLLKFGTQAERSDPDRFPILLTAKPLAYRYCIMYNDASTPIGGLGEIGGDEMTIFCGDYSDIDKAAVFMHELGHNLGLRHGGADNINGKTNYPSIMNYLLSYRKNWNKTFWRLDYSRSELIAIQENDLSELDSVGVGGDGNYDEFFMPFFAIVADGAPCHDPELHGEPLVSYADLDPGVLTDLNLDCDVDDDGFAGDLNFLDGSGLPGTVDPSPGQTLLGQNDWANIVLKVSNGGGAFAGTVPDDEITDDQLAFIEENFPSPVCLADANQDGALNVLDFVAFQIAWQEQEPIGDCDDNAEFNILDFVCFQYLFNEGCD